MKNQTSKKLDIAPGTRIRGKWHHNEYVIRRKLGSGAIGSVYLCTINQKEAALKISDKSTSMMMEVNVLKSLHKVQGVNLGPSLMDVDDWASSNGGTFTFYVMEYIRGQALQHFLQHNGKEWIGVFMLQLLDDLEKLHQAGWIFGDLKEENLLVASSPTKLRWIDVGGTTQIGRAIKEYSEFYDRGYWEMGTRKAEPGYDLFAFAMVFLSLCYPRRFEKGKHPQQQLMKKLYEAPDLRMYRPALQKALQGNYQTSAQMRQEVSEIIHHMRQRKGKQGNRMSLSFTGELVGISIISSIYYVFSLFLS
ncbi:protein kinase [Virgibacillus halophilus]|uniref:Protein kinase n=1 Tax=Tigheibacillus halophilus TaxID=361280 RepID=A0ABU5C6C2_9BACI|nr:protein kinase [Virgibacillus halophilus]